MPKGRLSKLKGILCSFPLIQQIQQIQGEKVKEK